NLRLPGGARNTGILDPRYSRQVLDAGLDHLGAVVPGLPNPAREQVPERAGAPRPARLPQPGALRDRLGRRGRGDGVLRLDAPVRTTADPVRQADRIVPARPAEA